MFKLSYITNELFASNSLPLAGKFVYLQLIGL